MDKTAPAQWIARFTRRHGRPPRILHLGNIANNAYQTAKMLNDAGADCDVLCPDYYHIMGTPEWDDADFAGDYGSQACPAWHRVDLGGFARPAWFAQGPRRLAIAYLLARRRGQRQKAARLWRRLEADRARLADAAASGNTAPRQGRGEALRQAVEGLAGRLLPQRLSRPEDADHYSPAYAAAMAQRLATDAQRFFPDREMPFGTEAAYYARVALLHKRLFALYDVVQGYATEAIWPYLAGCRHYVAWEHGTLRTFPYEDNDRGRLLLLAYAAAGAVYVTNVDCYDSAVYITRHSGAPIVCGLHGFDTERLLARQARATAAADDLPAFAGPGEALFFCPARVDIDPHYGTYLKANDMLYRALARLHREKGGGFKVLQLEWGGDVERLKAMIATECGALARDVVWHAPFRKPEFYRLLQQTTLVFDNFLLPLMGGNGIETLMSGHAALVNKRIPEAVMLRFFPVMWPVFAIDDEKGIYRAAKTALEHPEECLALAQKGREWILQYHSHQAIVDKNCQAYQLVLPQ